MPEYAYPYPDPVVDIAGARELVRDLVVIPDRRVPLVPNIGIIGGTHSVLVVETGMGPATPARFSGSPLTTPAAARCT